MWDSQMLRKSSTDKKRFSKILWAIYFIGLLLALCLGKVLGESSDEKVDYSSYIEQMQFAIKKNWHPPVYDKSCKPKIFFKVSKDGDISDQKIICSSGDTEMDRSLLNALKSAGHFPPTPSKEQISVQFTFRYNAHDNLQLRTNWRNVWNLESPAYDLSHAAFYKLLVRDFDSGNLLLIIKHYSPFLFMLFMALIVSYRICRWLKDIARLFTRLPDQQAIPTLASGTLEIKNYPKYAIKWDKYCRTPNVAGLLISGLGICVMMTNSNNSCSGYTIVSLGMWQIPSNQFYFWAGVLLLPLGLVFAFGIPRFFSKLKELTEKPGTQAIVTVGKGKYSTLMARVESYGNGKTSDSKNVHLMSLSKAHLPASLPFTDKAEVYLDDKSDSPTAIRIGGFLFYAQASPLFKRALFTPWKL